jgi:hypothetical protein
MWKLVCVIAIAMLATGCGDQGTATQEHDPSAPSTLAPVSPQPGQIATTFTEAMLLAMPIFTGRGSTVTLSEIESISYVETTVAGAQQILGDEDTGASPDTTAWVIVAYGRFREGRDSTVTVTTAEALVIAGRPSVRGHTSNARYDLGSAGKEVVIPVGPFPELDVHRVGAPTATVVVRPSLELRLTSGDRASVGGVVDVSISAQSNGASYSGYQWELQWNDAILDFAEARENTSGHGGSLCAPAAITIADAPPETEWVGQGAGCVFPSESRFDGELVTISARCARAGTTEVALVTPAFDPDFGTMLIGPGGELMEAAFVNLAVTVTCAEP